MSAKVQPIEESLRKRMDAVSAGAAPSLVPFVPPPAKEEEVIPDLKEIMSQKKDYLEAKRLILRSIELAEAEKPIKKEREQITAKLKNLLGRSGVAKAMVEDIRVNYYAGERSSIDGGKLLTLGVAPSIIREATNVTTTYTLKLTRQAEEE